LEERDPLLRRVAGDRLVDIFADDLVTVLLGVSAKLVSLSRDALVLLGGAHSQIENRSGPAVATAAVAVRMTCSHDVTLPVRVCVVDRGRIEVDLLDRLRLFSIGETGRVVKVNP